MSLITEARIRSLMQRHYGEAPAEGEDSEPHILLQQQILLAQLQQQLQQQRLNNERLTTEVEFLRFLETGGPSPPVVRPISDAPQSGANSAVVSNGSHQVGDGRGSHAPHSSAVDALATVGHHYPRLRAVVLFIAIPLLCLIGVCFLCGHLLATFEMPEEIKANRIAIRQRMNLTEAISLFTSSAVKLERISNRTTTNSRSKSKDAGHANASEASIYDNDQDRVRNHNDRYYTHLVKSVSLGVPQLSFHWMKCAPVNFIEKMGRNLGEDHQGSSKPTQKTKNDINMLSPMEGNLAEDHQGSSKSTDKTKNNIDMLSPMEGNLGEDHQGSSKPTQETNYNIDMLSPMAIYGKEFLESMSREEKESIYAQDTYQREFNNLREFYISKYGKTYDSDEKAWEDADGHSECSASTLGGAMFWFTIMTTIGYGNAGVVTVEGRCLVYTVGFVSVIFFTAVIGQAGCVMVAVCDDCFKRSKYTRRLVSGWVASLFWLTCYCLWNLIFGAIVIAYWKLRLDEELLLKDAFWFSFASTTTIGFGDFHIRHAYVKWYDLFWIPLPILMGFVLLTNFALKFGEWMLETVGTKHLPNYKLEDVLRQQHTAGGLGGRTDVVESSPRRT